MEKNNNNSNNIIELKNIVKTYDNGFTAVDGFNLEVKRGEFVTFLGPSGCGKTTTLRMIAGFEIPTSGEILLDGQDISKLPPNKRPINTVFQRYALFPHLNIFDNIAFGLKLKKLPKAEIVKKVKKVLEMVDLEGFEDRKVATLSGGQQQRIAIARALVNEPEILLLDEPLGALDLKMRKEMQIELKGMHDRLGITFIYVTHDQTEAMTLGTRIVVMNAGVVQQVDTPQVLYDTPCNLFVAGFIGSPQMNFIDAQCVVEGAKAFLKFDKYQVELPEAKAKKLIDGGYAGKNVVFGIRPEDIYDSAEHLDKFATCKIDSDVTGYELLGAEVLLYFTVAGANMSARVDSDTPARYGDHIELAFDPHKIHVFDKETELTITN